MNLTSKIDRIILSVLVLWLFVVVLASYFGLARVVHPVLRASIVVSGIGVTMLLYFSFPLLRRTLDLIPDATIVALHGWRFLAGFAFLSAGRQGLLPELFVRNAGCGDIVVGMLVPFVLMLPEAGIKYIAFHVIGLADCLLAVGTGLYFTALLRDPLMNNFFGFPFTIIPWFGVGLSGASHLIVLNRLVLSPKTKRAYPDA